MVPTICLLYNTKLLEMLFLKASVILVLGLWQCFTNIYKISVVVGFVVMVVGFFVCLFVVVVVFAFKNRTP